MNSSCYLDYHMSFFFGFCFVSGDDCIGQLCNSESGPFLIKMKICLIGVEGSFPNVHSGRRGLAGPPQAMLLVARPCGRRSFPAGAGGNPKIQAWNGSPCVIPSPAFAAQAVVDRRRPGPPYGGNQFARLPRAFLQACCCPRACCKVSPRQPRQRSRL